jgi:aminoglycoside/choline kinase family phosphotransferase
MNSDPRLAQLHEWIKENLGNIEYSLDAISGDASFRRYFRLVSSDHHFIAVDSPPEKESNDAFIHVTHLLAAEGLPVPHIHYSSLDFGFFLLNDLGDELLLDILNEDNVENLYNKALNALAIIQQTSATSLPLYDENLLLQEMELFREWFLTSHLSLQINGDDNQMLNDTFNDLANNALQQPQVFVHRDFHSRNLMNIDSKHPGIIDYQDAVLGPITYDLVSLLRDCYIAWPNEKVNEFALAFYNKVANEKTMSNTDEESFLKWFDLMGIQRHLKAIGIFSRLNIRDNKANYLQDIPRTLSYIKSVAENHPETHNLSVFLNKKTEF